MQLKLLNSFANQLCYLKLFVIYFVVYIKSWYMGFRVDADKNIVTVDHSINSYSVTTPEGNPVTDTFGELQVTSIFSRTKGKREPDAPGDNSPMLYALKNIGNIKTTRNSVYLLNESFKAILPVFLSSADSWGVAMPLPSSSKLTSVFAKRVCKESDGLLSYCDALSKVTAGDVLESLPGLPVASNIRTAIRQKVKGFIKSHSIDEAFQIKVIPVHLRHYLNPIRFNPHCVNQIPEKILLIDDMVTSGTSLVCAMNAIKAVKPSVDIQALTLFGSSRGR
ncbi:MAG: phosphoribosyltransferase [Plesiomonas shigelloides]